MPVKSMYKMSVKQLHLNTNKVKFLGENRPIPRHQHLESEIKRVQRHKNSDHTHEIFDVPRVKKSK